MELIVNLKNNLDQDEIKIIKSLGAEIVYQSQFIPLIGVKVDTSSKGDQIKKLSFVETVRTPLKGEYLEGEFLTTYFFTPPASRRPLSNSNYHGWGDTRVVVIDSGVNHPSVIEHIDFTNTGHTDQVGHGSCVANIIKYFAKGVNLYSAKVGNGQPDELWAMRALEWAATEKKAHVINISFGFKQKHKCTGNCDISKIVNAIVYEGVIVTVAAGNDGPSVDTLRCPSCASGAITVGALENDKKVSDYSSRGPLGGSKPNIVASGRVQIDAYNFGGTSCASPVVAGTVASVIKSVSNVNMIYSALYGSADDIKLPRHVQGMGALNIEKFTEAINHARMDRARQGQE
ncbi:Subtilisin E precursor [Pelotomaculum sp. FP]|uniref:S8 family peptidase n=1 Tax=Pelotomaculum sp. FP TaxID=261474 RepID=UPI001065B27C|nr:S8 family serine peptidase [Pelotomaculum sp. FP]TEB10608.1 Subtilisin E precursor [Pelotomaculum sp. FP]